MKLFSIVLISLLGIDTSPVLSQLILHDLFAKQDSLARAPQRPIMTVPDIVLPSPEDDKTAPPTGDVMISDMIGIERVINIFAGFTRDIDTISRRLDDSTQNSTILAPLNSALQNLPRKPWEDPQDYDALGQGAYEGEGGEDRAHKNLRRFVETHVVPVSPWAEGEKVETLGGRKIWWENIDGKQTVGSPV